MQLERLSPRRLYRAAQRRLLGPAIGTLTHVKTSEPVVALTFDDGPHPGSTPQLLDLLARHDARATFFMLGEAAQQFPDLVRRAAEEGHAIGNHTWSHASLARLGRRERLEEIHACEATLGGVGHRLFRPPYGEQTLGARLDLLRCRYTVVAWNMDSGDWWNPNSASIQDYLLQRIRPGSIILMHDAIHRPPHGHRSGEVSRPTHFDRSAMLAALDAVLRRLQGRIRCVTVPELMRCGCPQQTLWSSWADSPAVRR